MQWLPFLIICVWISQGACDFDCYVKEANKCIKEQLEINPEFTEFNFCKFQKRAVDCGTMAAVKCNTNFIAEAKKLQSVVDDMCEAGSNLNIAIEKNRDCITKSIVDVSCVDFLSKILGKNPTQEEILEAQKESCRRIDEIVSCTTEKVRQNCPSDGLTAFKAIYDPSTELQRKACKYIILPHVQSDHPTNGKLPMFYGPLEFII